MGRWWIHRRGVGRRDRGSMCGSGQEGGGKSGKKERRGTEKKEEEKER